MGIFTRSERLNREGEIKENRCAKIRACLYFFSRGHRACVEFYDAGFQPSSVSRQSLTGIRTCRCFEHGRLIIPLCLVALRFTVYTAVYWKGLKGARAPLSASERGDNDRERWVLGELAFRSNHGISSIMNEILRQRYDFHRWKSWSRYLARQTDKR